MKLIRRRFLHLLAVGDADATPTTLTLVKNSRRPIFDSDMSKLPSAFMQPMSIAFSVAQSRRIFPFNYRPGSSWS
jgi:hypothetical protein